MADERVDKDESNALEVARTPFSVTHTMSPISDSWADSGELLFWPCLLRIPVVRNNSILRFKRNVTLLHSDRRLMVASVPPLPESIYFQGIQAG
jgi:hypothetical protein